ncbi:interleukin-1 receptor-associated kinase 3-like isoform X2 [Arapaima gigas]
MNQMLVAAVLAVVLCVVVSARESPPKVSVYTRNPGEHGKPNKLICHTTGFHPPDIEITLTKNGQPIPESECKQSDLTFSQDWSFELTKTASIIPTKSDVNTSWSLICRSLERLSWSRKLMECPFVGAAWVAHPTCSMAPVNAATSLFDVPPSLLEAVCAIVDSARGSLGWRALASRVLSSWHEVWLAERLEAAGGSPTRELLWLWAQRSATVGDLQRALEDTGHRRAARLLSAPGGSARLAPHPALADVVSVPPSLQFTLFNLVRSFRRQARKTEPFRTAVRPADGGRRPALSYEDVLEGTGNFHPSLKIGGGPTSDVYRGTKGDLTFAVKVFKQENKASWKKQWTQFRTELQVLQLYQHPNILELWGCFSDRDRYYLLYPYLANGSLSHRLHSQVSGGSRGLCCDCLTVLSTCPLPLQEAGAPLTWQVRQDVINGVAKAIHFLHTAQPCSVVCANITSANILLDRSLQPKLCDLGAAHLRPQCLDQSGTITMETGCHSTLGYLPPEYIRDGKLSTKVDVYSLGVVSSSDVCGLAPLPCAFQTDLLQEMVEDSGSLDVCLQTLDPSAGHWPHPPVLVLGLLRLALECTATRPKCRPSTQSVREYCKRVPAAQPIQVTTPSVPVEDDETQSVSRSRPCECSQSEIIYGGSWGYQDGGISSAASQSSALQQRSVDLYSSWPVQCSCAAEADGHECEDCRANGFASAELGEPQGRWLPCSRSPVRLRANFLHYHFRLQLLHAIFSLVCGKKV